MRAARGAARESRAHHAARAPRASAARVHIDRAARAPRASAARESCRAGATRECRARILAQATSTYQQGNT